MSLGFFCNKKITSVSFLLILIIAVNYSCSSDNDSENTIYPIKVSTDKNWIEADQSVVQLAIESDHADPWEIIIPAEDKSWIQTSQSKGTGNATVELKFAKNTSKTERFFKLLVSNSYEQKPVYITQAGAKEGAIDINNAKWMELPTKASIANTFLIGHNLPDNNKVRNYSMLYDTINKFAYWVAYPMHSSYIGSANRTDEWGFDPAIDKKYQPELFRGFGVGGIDRGHQIPSADRTINRAANVSTFYFSNMTAQNSTLNQGIWADLEGRVRVWTKQCDTLYVVTGAMIQSATSSNIEYVNDNAGTKVAKPKYYYKALAKKMGNTYYTVAFRMNNSAPGSGKKYNDFRMTITDLEKETGFSFFPQLPTSDKNKIVADQWN